MQLCLLFLHNKFFTSVKVYINLLEVILGQAGHLAGTYLLKANNENNLFKVKNKDTRITSRMEKHWLFNDKHLDFKEYR